MTDYLCSRCKEPGCVGHCPMCNSNHIGGGGCNGMFCVDCDWDGDSTDPYELTPEEIKEMSNDGQRTTETPTGGQQ